MQDRLVSEVIEPMACDGLRTISVAYKDFVPGKAEENQVHFHVINNVTVKIVGLTLKKNVLFHTYSLSFIFILFLFLRYFLGFEQF